MNFYTSILCCSLFLLQAATYCAEEHFNIPAEAAGTVGQLQYWDITQSHPKLAQWLAVRYYQQHNIPITSKRLTGTDFTGRIAWRHDGKILAIGSRHAILLYNREGDQIGSLDHDGEDVAGLAWSPDGTILASGTNKGNIRLWDLNGRMIAAPFVLKREIQSPYLMLEWSPNSQILAVGTLSPWQQLSLINRQGNKIASTAHDEGIYNLAWNADGTRLAFVTADGHSYLLDNNGNQLQKLCDGGCFRIAWSPDGRVLATRLDSHVYLWDRDGNYTGITLDGHSKIDGLDWSPEGNILATGGEWGNLLFWNREGQQIANPQASGPISGLMWSADGKILAQFYHEYTEPKNEHYVHITLRGRDGQRINSQSGKELGWSHDGNIAALVYGNATIRFFDSTLQQIGHESTCLASMPDKLVWNPGGTKLVTYGRQEMHLWDLIPTPLRAECKMLTVDQIMLLLRIYQYAQHNQIMLMNATRYQVYLSLPTVIHDIVQPYVRTRWQQQ